MVSAILINTNAGYGLLFQHSNSKSDHSYQIEAPRFSQEFHYASLWPFISDWSTPLLAGIPLCKSRELSQRGFSISQLCSIRHDIPVVLHTPGAYGQCSMFDQTGDKQPVVLGTRCGTWWPWYGQFEVGWPQPLQLWLSGGISLIAPVLVSRGRDLSHARLHPLGLNQLLNVGVDQWLQICIVDTCQGSISWSL